MVLVVEAANAIFRYASTPTTMIFSRTPKERVRVGILAFLRKLDHAALSPFADWVLVANLAKQYSVATFAARRRTCIATACAPFSAPKLVVSIVCAAWSRRAHVSTTDISFRTQEFVAMRVLAMDCQDLLFSGDLRRCCGLKRTCIIGVIARFITLWIRLRSKYASGQRKRKTLLHGGNHRFGSQKHLRQGEMLVQ